MYILTPEMYILAPKMEKGYLLKRYSPSDSSCTFFPRVYVKKICQKTLHKHEDVYTQCITKSCA